MSTAETFTLNALYYSPQGPYVLDYVGGFKDIKKKQIRSILPLEETFLDDPVRLIRAVKYAAKADFSLSRPLKKAIRKYAGEMGCCSSSRLTEEVFKILQCGKARKIFEELMGYGILPPHAAGDIQADRRKNGGPLT